MVFIASLLDPVDDADRVQINYGHNYDRLVDIKRACDPGNLFRIKQNIVS